MELASGSPRLRTGNNVSVACGGMASLKVPAAIRAEACLLHFAWLLRPRAAFEIPQVAPTMQSLGTRNRGWPCATSADDRPLP